MPVSSIINRYRTSPPYPVLTHGRRPHCFFHRHFAESFNGYNRERNGSCRTGQASRHPERPIPSFCALTTMFLRRGQRSKSLETMFAYLMCAMYNKSAGSGSCPVIDAISPSFFLCCRISHTSSKSLNAPESRVFFHEGFTTTRFWFV